MKISGSAKHSGEAIVGFSPQTTRRPDVCAVFQKNGVASFNPASNRERRAERDIEPAAADSKANELHSVGCLRKGMIPGTAECRTNRLV